MKKPKRGRARRAWESGWDEGYADGYLDRARDETRSEREAKRPPKDRRKPAPGHDRMIRRPEEDR